MAHFLWGPNPFQHVIEKYNIIVNKCMYTSIYTVTYYLLLCKSDPVMDICTIIYQDKVYICLFITKNVEIVSSLQSRTHLMLPFAVTCNNKAGYKNRLTRQFLASL